IGEAAARLACYDGAADALAKAQAAGDVVVVDRAQVREVRRQAFGFHLPSLDLLPRAPKEAPLQQVDFVLASAGRTSEGKWAMVAEDGARWVQTDSEDIDNPPHAGSRLLVRAGALGGFFCKVDNQIAVRCRRQQ
ncbi:MAG: hypothetical protein INR64_13150, partial [Caulobacteraceae bacterium]|nr:hypothetical protein [Caulobacter sp.]